MPERHDATLCISGKRTGVTGPDGGGEFVTRPVLFEGSRLQLNAARHGLGEIWVDLQDESGVPLPGFSRTEAVSIGRKGTAHMGIRAVASPRVVSPCRGSHVARLSAKSSRRRSVKRKLMSGTT